MHLSDASLLFTRALRRLPARHGGFRRCRAPKLSASVAISGGPSLHLAALPKEPRAQNSGAAAAAAPPPPRRARCQARCARFQGTNKEEFRVGGKIC